MANKQAGRPGEATRMEKKWPVYCKTFIVKDSNGTVKELVFPKALDLDRPKRDRTTFSNRQLSRLEEEFNCNQYIVGKDRTALAKSLGLSETQVKVWFQNRRTKLKKENGRHCEGNDSQAESKAAQNVLKLLAYQTSVSYPCLQNQIPVDPDPTPEAHMRSNCPKLSPTVLTPQTCLHAETRNDKQWQSVETTPKHKIPPIHSYSPKDVSMSPPTQKLDQMYKESRKHDGVFHMDSSPMFQKHLRGFELACSKHEEDGELMSQVDCDYIQQTSEHDDCRDKYGSGVGSAHLKNRGFREVNAEILGITSERDSRNILHGNDSYHQDSISTLEQQNTNQETRQKSSKETSSPSRCVQSHSMPSHRVEVSTWVQGYQSQYVSGPPFLAWYENSAFAPSAYSNIGQPTLHEIYGNLGSPKLHHSTYLNINPEMYNHYSTFSQPNPSVLPDLPGTVHLYPPGVTNRSTLPSATFDPQHYREGFDMAYQSPTLGIHEHVKRVIGGNRNKQLGFKLCSTGTLRNDQMLSQLPTKTPFSYFNQS